jgi:hypothetical protein
MLHAFAYCGWNLDDLVVEPAPVLARAWLELGATQVDVGSDVQVRIFVQEDSAAAQGFRGGPVNLAFDATRLVYAGGFYPSSIIQPPFNALGKTSGSLLPGLVAELGGATTQSGLGDGTPVLYAVLNFRGLAAGPATLELAPASTGLALTPPVGQVGTWRVDYGSPASLTVVQPPPPPLARLKLEGPGDTLSLGDACLVKVYAREDSAQANGFLGGPLDLYFDADRVALTGPLDAAALATILQAPFNSLGAEFLSGSLEGNRIDELGGVTVQSGHGNGAWVLFAVVPFQATAAGTAIFSAGPGESGFALTQPVGQLQWSQIDYGTPLEVTISARPRARLTGLPSDPTRSTSASVTVEGYGVTNYRVRQADGSYGPVTPTSQPISLTGLADGRQTLAVIAQGSGDAWQLEEEATEYAWTVDTTPPSTPALEAATPPVGGALSGTTVALTWRALADGLTGVPGVWWAVDRTPTTAAPGTSNDSSLPAALIVGSLGQGAYWLHAAAVDGAGNWTPTAHFGPWTYDTVPPTAVPGGPYAFTASALLDGRLSNDATSGIASYLWEFVQNPLGAGSLTDPSSATPTFAAVASGTYRVRLTVSDRAGLSHSAEVDVVFSRQAPVLHSVVIGDGAALVSQPEVTLTLEISSGAAAALDYRVGEGPGSGPWLPLSAARQTEYQVPYTLSSADGLKTLYVTVRDRDYPAFSSAEVSTAVILNRNAWRFAIDVSNANNPTLEIGMQINATNGFDEGLDREPDDGPGLGQANLEQGSRLYRTDVRGSAESAEWWIRVRTTTSTDVVLSWGPAVLPSGSLTLCEWDEFLPGPLPGTLVSMASAGSVRVPVRTTLLLCIRFDLSADTVPPAVILSSSAPDPTHSAPIPWTAAFSETVTGFELEDITVTNGTAGEFTGAGAHYEFTVTPAAQGTVTVSIGAGVCEDAAGNLNLAAAALTRVYDTVAPQAPLVTVPTPTNDPTPTWTWAAGGGDGNGTFRHQLDGSAGVWTETAGLSFSPGTALGDGDHTLYVQERDDAGNWSLSGSATVIVDTVRPTVTGLADDGVPTRSKTWTWSAAKEGISFRHRVDTDPEGIPTAAYSAVSTATQAGGDGLHYLHVQARDEAGNESAVVTVYALLDNTAPPPPSVTGSSPAQTSTPTWHWTGGGDGGNGVFRLQLDGTAAAGWTETMASSFTPGAALPNGPHTLYVQERDTAGNWSGAGSFLIEVDVFCTVTYAAGEHGRLAGDLVQVVPYNGSTTAVEAVADYLYVFDRWNDQPAQTSDNPRVVSGVTGDMTLTALFRPATAAQSPDGQFLAMVDAAAPPRRKLWDLTGAYATNVTGSPLTMDLVHDPSGRLSGTATYTVAKHTPVTMPIKGSVMGTSGSVIMKCLLRGTDLARTVTVSLTLNLAVDTEARRLVGRLVGSTKIGDTTTPMDAPVTFDIPGGMDGTWTLAFQLAQSGPAITGTATLTLSNGVDCTFLVKGRAGANSTVVLALAGDGSDLVARAIDVRTTVVTLEGDWARLEGFSANGYGQALAW